MKKYQPSNGTEGMIFMEHFCENCIHEKYLQDPEKFDDEKDKCRILSNSMIYSVNDPEYPIEWTYDENDKPTCTNWVKWDWDNDQELKNR